MRTKHQIPGRPRINAALPTLDRLLHSTVVPQPPCVAPVIVDGSWSRLVRLWPALPMSRKQVDDVVARGGRV